MHGRASQGPSAEALASLWQDVMRDAINAQTAPIEERRALVEHAVAWDADAGNGRAVVVHRDSLMRITHVEDDVLDAELPQVTLTAADAQSMSATAEVASASAAARDDLCAVPRPRRRQLGV